MKLLINFTLKTGVSGEVPILAILNYGYKEYDVLKQKNVYRPLKYYTGIKVPKNEWDEMKKLPYKKSIQTQLLNIEQLIRDVFHFLNLSDELTPDRFKSELDQKIKGKKSETVKRVRIIDFVMKEVTTDPELKRQTQRSYQTMCGYIAALEELIAKPVYSNEFDEKYYKLFMEIVRSRVKRNNSVLSAFRLLRATLRRIAFKYKVPVFNITEELPASQKVRATQSQKVYMSFEHIQKVIDYQPTSKREKNIKMIMLTLLMTGVRFSDVFKVKPEYYYEKDNVSFRYARFVTQKNGKEVIIPMLKPLEDAIADNEGQPAFKVCEMLFNRSCKELIRNCGIEDEQTLSFSDQFGKIKFERKKFYEFVSSHTGRRSFISNLINHIPVTLLSKITTHAKVSGNAADLGENNVIYSYDQTTLLENAALFMKTLARVQREDQSHFTIQLV